MTRTMIAILFAILFAIPTVSHASPKVYTGALYSLSANEDTHMTDAILQNDKLGALHVTIQALDVPSGVVHFTYDNDTNMGYILLNSHESIPFIVRTMAYNATLQMQADFCYEDGSCGIIAFMRYNGVTYDITIEAPTLLPDNAYVIMQDNGSFQYGSLYFLWEDYSVSRYDFTATPLYSVYMPIISS